MAQCDKVERYTKNKLSAFLKVTVTKHIRTCKTMHECKLCTDGIQNGDRYFDGGHNNRAHTKCVKEARAQQQPAG